MHEQTSDILDQCYTFPDFRNSVTVPAGIHSLKRSKSDLKSGAELFHCRQTTFLQPSLCISVPCSKCNSLLGIYSKLLNQKNIINKDPTAQLCELTQHFHFTLYCYSAHTISHGHCKPSGVCDLRRQHQSEVPVFIISYPLIHTYGSVTVFNTVQCKG